MSDHERAALLDLCLDDARRRHMPTRAEHEREVSMVFATIFPNAVSHCRERRHTLPKR